MQQEALYPIRFSVDYPDREMKRGTTFFRLFIRNTVQLANGEVIP